MSDKSPFNLRPTGKIRPADPEAVFADLRPRDEAVKHLWSHQADILREYHKKSTSRDVALELPTGMGKTLVGLLVAEYRRRAFDERVVYLCPTRQLAKQVMGHATSYGISAVLLVGQQRAYAQPDYARYAASEAVAITTYSGVFNINPRLNDAQVMILDDAHSGGDFVADLWSLVLPRALQVYRDTIELYANAIPRSLFMRLLSSDVDPRDRLETYKVPTQAFLALTPALTELLDGSLQGDPVYGWRMVRDNLAATHLYVSWPALNVRPLIPPTLRHQPFSNTRQRVYMSATLGAGGELERLMGVERIERIPVPETWESQRTGRRFILFPSLSLPPDEVDELVRQAVKVRDRTLVICPSHPQAEQVAEQLKQTTDAAVLFSPAVEDSLTPFTEHDHAVLVLAGRYDGIDLPDQSCRQEALIGLPSALNLQERFLMDRLRAQVVLRDRIRTRLIQGVGRCTRNPRDYAAVLLCGTDILDFCLRRENREGMPRDLQAEMRFGLDNSEADRVEGLMKLLNVFFAQGSDWAQADEMIRALRTEFAQTTDPIASELMRVVGHEVRYGYAMWDGDFVTSLRLAREIGDQLPGDELRNYRAWWLYLASAVAGVLATSQGKEYVPLSSELLERARAAADVSWIRSIGLKAGGLRGQEQDQLTVIAAENIAVRIQELGLTGRRFEASMAAMREQLGSRDPETFHAGLASLGELLGFMTSRPKETGNPDVIWRLEPEVAVLWEVKNQAEDETPISLSTARQCVGHMNGAKGLLQLHDGEACYVIVACHRMETARDAVAQIGDTRAFPVTKILKLAEAVVHFLRRTRARAGETSDIVSIVREEITTAALEPRRVISEITATSARDIAEQPRPTSGS